MLNQCQAFLIIYSIIEFNDIGMYEKRVKGSAGMLILCLVKMFGIFNIETLTLPSNE